MKKQASQRDALKGVRKAVAKPTVAFSDKKKYDRNVRKRQDRALMMER